MRSMTTWWTAMAFATLTGSGTTHATDQQAAMTPTATSCAQAQATVDQLLATASARVESARQTNSASEMRSAVDGLQNVVRDVRTQLAPCATLKVEDPHSGHAVAVQQPAAAPAAPAAAKGIADSYASHGAAPAAPGASADIVAWLKAFDAAFVAKDLTRLAAFYHPEVTVYEGVGVDTGWADYRDTHLGPELKSFAQLEFGHLDPTVRMLGEHAAYVTSAFFLKAQANGKPIDVTGRETLVLEHADGAWTIRHQQIAVRARQAK
jgi:ketosteroid isomerase-like protein